ncbi:NADP-dependent oxidoreductase domain-containing protein [Aspergillus pseudodeflectus]|uniref:NADP-dependent oxidoreductase domain-containing protein n=1 Tax=Aspergillus pseudodeflectus TaxID=176178 RepID=A0ABR4JXX8_9EURO
MPEEKFFLRRPPPPNTLLGYYRALSKSAFIHVSPIALGDNWAANGVNRTSDGLAFKLLDTYFDNGGNFIDVANHYQSGKSEELVGQWMATRKTPRPTTKPPTQTPNNASTTSATGKVLYLGASNTPTWVVARANQSAVDHGKTPLSIYTGCWNVLDRSLEAEVIPMARGFDMAVAPWEVLCGGRLRSDAEEERRRATGEKGRDTAGTRWERTEQEINMVNALEAIAKEVGAHSLGAVAIAYLFHKHILSNVEAIDIQLTAEEIAQLEAVKAWQPGMPHAIIGDGIKNNILVDINAHVDQ